MESAWARFDSAPILAPYNRRGRRLETALLLDLEWRQPILGSLGLVLYGFGDVATEAMYGATVGFGFGR